MNLQLEETLITPSPSTDASKTKKALSGKAAIEAVEKVLKTTIDCLEDAKAEEITTIDLHDKTAIADYMVVASGRSHRHVGAVADQLLRKLKSIKAPTKVEGLDSSDWVLIDVGDIIVHIFRPEVREFYSLEKMWQLPAQDNA